MNRREAISAVTFLLGGTIIGAEAFLYGCKPKRESKIVALGSEELALLNDVGETILPATSSSPGAREAKVGEFIKTMIDDCYSDEERKVFLQGIQKLRDLSDKKYGKRFTKLSADEKHNLLLDLEKEAAEYAENKKPEDAEVHYYKMMKQLTVLGFLTSEVGATKAMRHVAVPGRFDACVEYKEGEKAWV